MVNVRDVASAAGVSVGTVSNVLNRPERVSETTVKRVRDVIDELGFVRNDAARQLRMGRSSTIGLVVLDARNPFFMDIARGAEDAAIERGMSVLIANSDDDPHREAAHLDLFEQQRAYGILVTPASGDASRVQHLASRGVNAVLVDRASEDSGLPAVVVNDIQGGRLAAEHLLSVGGTRLAFVGGPMTLQQVSDRLAGARSALSQRDASLEVIETPALTVIAGREAGARLARRPPQDRPDAVLAANDLVALGLIQALAMSGQVRIPEDMLLIGYDDIDFAASAVVPLSSIRQPAETMGRRAVELLMAPGTDRPSTITFEPILVARDSTRKP